MQVARLRIASSCRIGALNIHRILCTANAVRASAAEVAARSRARAARHSRARSILAERTPRTEFRRVRPTAPYCAARSEYLQRARCPPRSRLATNCRRAPEVSCERCCRQRPIKLIAFRRDGAVGKRRTNGAAGFLQSGDSPEIDNGRAAPLNSGNVAAISSKLRCASPNSSKPAVSTNALSPSKENQRDAVVVCLPAFRRSEYCCVRARCIGNQQVKKCRLAHARLPDHQTFAPRDFAQQQFARSIALDFGR